MQLSGCRFRASCPWICLLSEDTDFFSTFYAFPTSDYFNLAVKYGEKNPPEPKTQQLKEISLMK